MRSNPKDEFQWLKVEREANTPLFQQIVESVERAIKAGQLSPGERLPPVRALADYLEINSLTVSRAYKDLGERGLIAGRGPLGTFVNDAVDQESESLSNSSAGRWQARYPEDTFRRMLENSTLAGAISLTQAYPTVDAIDLKPFEQAIMETLPDRNHIYRYTEPDGASALKDALRDVVIGPTSGMGGPLIVTSGGQQAISLVMRQLLRPGDSVVFERPTYFGALDVARSIGARITGVDLEDDGLNVDQLEKAIEKEKPKLLFLMPNFQNPTGVTTSLAKRKRILELALKHNVPILEDDHAPEMRFRGEVLPNLKALADPEQSVFYVRGLGKSFIPGVRLGFVMPPSSYFQDIASQKSMADLHTWGLLQESFARYLRSPAALENVERQRHNYASVQESLLELLSSALPDGFEFTVPEGGFNLWVRTPPEIDAINLCWATAQRGVALLVGAPLFPDQENYNSFRLSYGIGNISEIQKAIERITAAIRDVSARGSQRPMPVV